MSTQNWIKTADKFPTDADLPVWVYRAKSKDVNIWQNALFATGSGWQEYTHWKPAAADIPAPPKEPTQGDKDAAAYRAQFGDHWPSLVLNGRTVYSSDIWHAALAYERAEVLKLLPTSFYGLGDAQCVISAIRARCGGAK